MKKIITTVIALLVMGSVSFAQDAAKPAPKKAKAATSEKKMDAKKADPKAGTAAEKPKASKAKAPAKAN